MINVLDLYYEFTFGEIVYASTNIGLQDIDIMITQSAAYGSQHTFDIGTNHGQPYDAPLKTTTQQTRAILQVHRDSLTPSNVSGNLITRQGVATLGKTHHDVI